MATAAELEHSLIHVPRQHPRIAARKSSANRAVEKRV